MKVISKEQAEQEQKMALESREAGEFLQELEGFEVVTQEDMDFVSEALLEVKKKKKELETEKRRVTDPLSEALNTVRGWFKGPIKSYEGAEKTLKKMLSDAHTRERMRQISELEAAGKASLAGNHDGAEALLDSASKQLQAGDGISFRESWDFEIDNFDEIPRAFLVVDSKRVLDHIRKHKGKVTVPGIRPVLRSTVAAKTG